MKNSTNILDTVTLTVCAIILAILFNGVILLIGAIYLGYKAYSSYKEFLQATEQETVKESMLLDDINPLIESISILVRAKQQSIKSVEIDWLPYQLGLNF